VLRCGFNFYNSKVKHFCLLLNRTSFGEAYTTIYSKCALRFLYLLLEKLNYLYQTLCGTFTFIPFYLSGAQ
jgi:hypothetical protein